MLIICQYCGTTQETGIVWSCRQCGAPYRLPEPIQEVNIQKQSPACRSIATIPQYGYPIIDFSKWQGDVDFDQLHGSDAVYSIIKSSQSDWADSKYSRNSSGLISRQMAFGLYHYLDTAYNIEDAAEFWAGQVNALAGGWRKLDQFTLVTPYGSKFRIYLDVEKNTGINGMVISPQIMANIVYAFKLAFEDKCKLIKFGIYTRKSFWDFYVSHSAWAANLPLWVAHYNQSVSAPAIPTDFKTWEVWQIDDKGLGVDGSAYGMQSHGIDVNRFNGSQSDLSDWAWVNGSTIPPIPGIETVIVNTTTLNIRNEPGTDGGDSTVIGTTKRGTELQVIDRETDSTGRSWVKTEAWVAEWLTKPK